MACPCLFASYGKPLSHGHARTRVAPWHTHYSILRESFSFQSARLAISHRFYLICHVYTSSWPYAMVHLSLWQITLYLCISTYLLQTQESAPSPDKSHDQARSLVQTPSCVDACRVHKAKEIHQMYLAKGVSRTFMVKGKP